MGVRQRRPAAGSRFPRPGRFRAAGIVLVLVVLAAGAKLVQVQLVQAADLSAQAANQRATVITIPAVRGAIVDRTGARLAFSVETRALSVNLRSMRKSWAAYARQHPERGQNYDTRAAAVAKFIAAKLPGRVTEQQLLAVFQAKARDFGYLADAVAPSIAAQITKEFPEIRGEVRAIREYPGNDVAANVVGLANWRPAAQEGFRDNLHGIAGLELARDHDLAGQPGRSLADTAQGSDTVVIPGTERAVRPAVPGNDLVLTLDADVQYTLQNRLAGYVARSHAKGGSAVVLDARTGEIYALAGDRTFDPNDPRTYQDPAVLTDRAVTTPFEPGSVHKIVTATAAIDQGITTPDAVHQVPGSLEAGEAAVHDARDHGTVSYTTTGIFAKSSNVGTLLLAREVGPDRYLDYLTRFGVGQGTGTGLPGETRGYVPPQGSWTGSTFGNLPIGQGLSMNVVQLAGMYQAIANDGVRVPPRIVKEQIGPDGTVLPEPKPAPVRVAGPRTARTVRDMLRAVVQGGADRGTAPDAALEGYQISAKTGTAQQIDPVTKGYSDSLYNITFAGILPADNPRFVVGIRLDAPDASLPAGSTAAPLFHDIASYLAQRYQIPVSPAPTPHMPLVADH